MSSDDFPCRLTGYWPFSATAAEKLMEGGTNDRKRNPLHTLEDFQNGDAEFVSVSGDYTIFPYGQRIAIDEWPDVIFRIVDTGSHFHGAGKVYREPGREPLDICVASSATPITPDAVATLFPGDTLDGGKGSINYAAIGGGGGGGGGGDGGGGGGGGGGGYSSDDIVEALSDAAANPLKSLSTNPTIRMLALAALVICLALIAASQWPKLARKALVVT
jgi:hypothetical protein